VIASLKIKSLMKNQIPCDRRSTLNAGGRLDDRTVNRQMSKKRNQRTTISRSGSRGTGSAGIVPVTFADLLVTTIGANSPASVLFNPTVVPTLTSIASVYQNFRYTHVKCYLLPQVNSTGTNAIWSVGFSSDVSAGIASITSNSQVIQCLPSATQSSTGSTSTPAGVTLPSAHLKLSSRHLLRNTSLKWFKCIGDADTNAWENFQFQLIFYNSGSSTESYEVLISGVCEFSSPIPSQLTSTLKFVQSDDYALAVKRRDSGMVATSFICPNDQFHSCVKCKRVVLDHVRKV